MQSEATTPSDAGLRRGDDPEAIKVANLGLFFAELARTCAALARGINKAEGLERDALVAQIGAELRDQADLTHDTARHFESRSRGYSARVVGTTIKPRRNTMSWFKKALTVVSYIATGGAPILAATGVGMPVAAILGAAGLASGAWLHFLDSPKTPADVIEAAKQSVALAKAVQAASGK